MYRFNEQTCHQSLDAGESGETSLKFQERFRGVHRKYKDARTPLKELRMMKAKQMLKIIASGKLSPSARDGVLRDYAKEFALLKGAEATDEAWAAKRVEVGV